MCKYWQCWDFNFLNPEIQFKDNESKITNKVKHLLTELKEFKFVPILVLKLKKYKLLIKQNIAPFIFKAETVISDIDDYFTVFYSIYSTIIRNIKSHLERFWVIFLAQL